MKVLFTLLIAALPILSNGRAELLKGEASYYHQRFNGRRTATGERFSNDSLTAASNRFPLQSKVRVTNLKDGTEVVVRINDRMGNKKRIIDLSQKAAKNLNFFGIGLAKVSVEKI